MQTVAMTNSDPEGFIVGLREVDPSVLIMGFSLKHNKIDGAVIRCEKLDEIMDWIQTRSFFMEEVGS